MNDRDQERRVIRRTTAEIQRSGWPGWIWAVPLAALGIVAWLAFRALASRGVDVTVEFGSAAGMKTGDTSVQYRGLKIGQVTGLKLTTDGRRVIAKLNINEDMKQFLRADTQFWLEGGNPNFADLASLKAIVAGPTIIMQPGGGNSARHFIGLDHRPTISGAHEPMISYSMEFDGDVGRLKVDAPVTLRGFTVGRVAQIGMHYDSASGMVRTPVIVQLDAKRFAIRGAHPGGRWRPVLDAALTQLVKHGLRGRLAQSPPFVGEFAVSLDFVPDAPDATLDASAAIPEIPTAAGGGLDSIVHRVNRVPIDRIATNVLNITSHVQSLVGSPELKDSLRHLDHSLAELDVTIRQTSPQVTQVVQSLRKTSDQMNDVAVSTDRLLGNGPTNQDRNVQAALHEVTEAARSLRSLADYLDRHPEALVRGRAGEQ